MKVQLGRKRAIRVTAIAVFALAICIGLLGGGQRASAGLPTIAPGQTQADSQVEGKLYRHLGNAVKGSSSDTRLRVIVHMPDQVDLNT